MAGGFAGAAENDLVAVGEEGTGFAGGKEDGLCAVAGEFEETASGRLGGAGDGAGGEDVADLQVATIAGVVGNELGGSPVEVLGVGFAEKIWLQLIFTHGYG